MLSSSAQQSEIEAARHIGIEAVLTKPIRHSRLLACLRSVVGSISAPEEFSSPPIATINTVTSPTHKRPLILVAEDNAVNQKLAVRLLDKLGYRADVVANGKEVLEAITRIPYAAVLMDCQMPEMDGFEATKKIREQKAATDTPLPIIAMTANAMNGDREYCLEAGMDDYIAKPVKPHELRAALERWVCFDGVREEGSK